MVAGTEGLPAFEMSGNANIWKNILAEFPKEALNKMTREFLATLKRT